MKWKYGPGKAPAKEVLKDNRRQTRRHDSVDDKMERGEHRGALPSRMNSCLLVLWLVQGIP